jgi:hypothetical protein
VVSSRRCPEDEEPTYRGLFQIRPSRASLRAANAELENRSNGARPWEKEAGTDRILHFAGDLGTNGGVEMGNRSMPHWPEEVFHVVSLDASGVTAPGG